MELIDRYIYAVTRHLPEKQRQDIARELRGHIEDMLIEKCGENEATDKDIEEVLKTLGEPTKLAEKYSARPRYMIGPELFGTYTRLLKIVLPAVAFAMLVAMIVNYISAPTQQVWNMISTFISEELSAIIQAFAWLTAIFAIVECFATDTVSIKWKKHAWEPADLPEIPAKNAAIKRSDPIGSIVLIAIFFIFFNFILARPDQYLFVSHGVVVQLFNPDVLYSYLPLIDICFGIGIVKEIIKLVFGYYDLKLGIVNTALSLIGTILAVIAFSDLSIWNMFFVKQLADAGAFTLSGNIDPQQIMVIGGRVIVGLILFGFVAETVRMFFRIYRSGKWGGKIDR